jgi:hypothetical protein
MICAPTSPLHQPIVSPIEPALAALCTQLGREDRGKWQLAGRGRGGASTSLLPASKDVRVFTRATRLRVPMSAFGTTHGDRVPAEQLQMLRLEVLRDLCASVEEGTSGNKPDFVFRLVRCGIRYDQLVKDELVEILKKMNLPSSGNEDELIARIRECGSSAAAGRGGSASAAHCGGARGFGVIEEMDMLQPQTPREPSSSTRTAFVPGAMSRNTYRARMAKAGFPLEDDQHVCHIISSKNGGADHSDNYIVASASFNLATGARHDAIIANFIGPKAHQRAVAVSKNFKGDADKLFQQGADALRTVRQANRNQE